MIQAYLLLTEGSVAKGPSQDDEWIARTPIRCTIEVNACTSTSAPQPSAK
jgi:hypothetical protein